MPIRRNSYSNSRKRFSRQTRQVYQPVRQAHVKPTTVVITQPVKAQEKPKAAVITKPVQTKPDSFVSKTQAEPERTKPFTPTAKNITNTPSKGVETLAKWVQDRNGKLFSVNLNGKKTFVYCTCINGKDTTKIHDPRYNKTNGWRALNSKEVSLFAQAQTPQTQNPTIEPRVKDTRKIADVKPTKDTKANESAEAKLTKTEKPVTQKKTKSVTLISKENKKLFIQEDGFTKPIKLPEDVDQIQFIAKNAYLVKESWKRGEEFNKKGIRISADGEIRVSPGAYEIQQATLDDGTTMKSRYGPIAFLRAADKYPKNKKIAINSQGKLTNNAYHTVTQSPVTNNIYIPVTSWNFGRLPVHSIKVDGKELVSNYKLSSGEYKEKVVDGMEYYVNGVDHDPQGELVIDPLKFRGKSIEFTYGPKDDPATVHIEIVADNG